MHQDRVGTGGVISARAAQRFARIPAGDVGFDACHHAEVVIGLGILTGGNLAAELIDVGQRLALTVDEAVGLGKELVLDAYAGHAALFKLAHQAPQVIEVAVAGVAIEQDWDARDIGHELDHIDHLRPARLIVVAHAELR